MISMIERLLCDLHTQNTIKTIFGMHQSQASTAGSVCVYLPLCVCVCVCAYVRVYVFVCVFMCVRICLYGTNHPQLKRSTRVSRVE